MSDSGKRLSILSQPSIHEIYSIPKFNSEERDYFFTFNEAELKASKQFHSHRNRVYFLLMLGYFNIKPVCLIYNWNEIETDYEYISKKYFPAANKKKHNIDRFTRRRLYKKVFEIVEYQRYDKTIESELVKHLGFVA